MKPVKTTFGKFLPNLKLKLREQLGEVMRLKQFSHRTESAYWHWIKGFILFHRDKSKKVSVNGVDTYSMAQAGGTTTTRAFNAAGQMLGERYAGGPQCPQRFLTAS